MRYYLSRQYDMLKNVEGFLKSKQKTLISKVPALRDYVEDFMQRQEQLLNLYIGKKHVVAINTAQKKSARVEFVRQLMKLTAVLRAHRFQNNDATVRHRKNVSDDASSENYIHYTFTDFRNLSAGKLAETGEQVIEAAKKIKSIDRYGITAEDVKDVQAYYKEFAAIKESPLQRKKEVAVRNNQLATGIKESIAILENRIDPLIRIAAIDDRNLEGIYKSARKVLPRGQGRPSDKEVKYRKSRQPKAGKKK